MLSADILAEGVRGLVPNPFGIAANTDTFYYMLHSSTVLFFFSFSIQIYQLLHKKVNLKSYYKLFIQLPHNNAQTT